MMEIRCQCYLLPTDMALSGDFTVSGRVLVAPSVPTSLPRGSCLTVTVQKAQFCTRYPCTNPILARRTYVDPRYVSGRSFRYSVTLANPKETRYVITSVLNIGWCARSNEMLRVGDFKNEYLQMVQIQKDKMSINKDLSIEKYRQSDKESGK